MPNTVLQSVPESDSPPFLEAFADRRATAEDYLQASDSLRESAGRAFDAGDLVLASEACWGVVARALQAVAERHGIPHSTNLDFLRINKWLISETQNREIADLYRWSYNLHRNFYRIVLKDQEISDLAQFALRLADEVRDFA